MMTEEEMAEKYRLAQMEKLCTHADIGRAPGKS